MSSPRYEPPPIATVADVRQALKSGMPSRDIASLLVGAALNPDATEVQSLCTDLLVGPDCELAAVAATCLGHLARIHGFLDDASGVMELLTNALGDPITAGHADDALDDLETFLGVARPGPDHK
jgi:hypothetical protein